MATQLIQVPEGDEIKPGDEIYDGRFWRIVRPSGHAKGEADSFKPCYVSTGQLVRRKFNPQPKPWSERDAFECNE